MAPDPPCHVQNCDMPCLMPSPDPCVDRHPGSTQQARPVASDQRLALIEYVRLDGSSQELKPSV